MRKDEMLAHIKNLDGTRFPVAFHILAMILIELVKRLPDEAPKLEGGPNVNLQD